MAKRVIRERRRTERLDIPLKIVQRLFRGREVIKTLTSNISGGGLRFSLHYPLKRGDRLKTSIHFPMDDRPITAFSEVIWCRERISEGKKVFDTGIRYVRILPKDRTRFVFLFCETMMNYFMSHLAARVRS